MGRKRSLALCAVLATNSPVGDGFVAPPPLYPGGRPLGGGWGRACRETDRSFAPVTPVSLLDPSAAPAPGAAASPIARRGNAVEVLGAGCRQRRRRSVGRAGVVVSMGRVPENDDNYFINFGSDVGEWGRPVSNDDDEEGSEANGGAGGSDGRLKSKTKGKTKREKRAEGAISLDEVDMDAQGLDLPESMRLAMAPGPANRRSQKRQGLGDTRSNRRADRLSDADEPAWLEEERRLRKKKDDEAAEAARRKINAPLTNSRALQGKVRGFQNGRGVRAKSERGGRPRSREPPPSPSHSPHPTAPHPRFPLPSAASSMRSIPAHFCCALDARPPPRRRRRWPRSSTRMLAPSTSAA